MRCYNYTCNNEPQNVMIVGSLGSSMVGHMVCNECLTKLYEGKFEEVTNVPRQQDKGTEESKPEADGG